MMDCPKCRTGASDDATSCPSCEAPLTWRVLMPDGQSFGPYSTADVRQYVAEGRIPGTANVLQEATGVQMALHRAGFVGAEAAVPPVGPPPPDAAPVPARRRSSMWLIGVVIVGAGLLLLAIFSAIMIPVFARARMKAQQTACLSNVKQLGMAYIMYATDWDDHFPNGADSVTIGQQVYPYVRNWGLFTCPSAPNELGFEWNPNLAGAVMKDISKPANVPAVWDAGATLADFTPAPGLTSGRHNGGDNIGFVDGHAKWLGNTATLTTAIPVQGDEKQSGEEAEGG